MTTATDTRTCPKCSSRIISRWYDDFTNCVFCGWEDYGPPRSARDIPDFVKCPGVERWIRLVGDGCARCPACDSHVNPTSRGRTPSHRVMSDTACSGSKMPVVRVVSPVDGKHMQEKGCSGCGKPADNQKSTTMENHQIADSPKVAFELNRKRT